MIRLSICILVATATLFSADKPNRDIQELQRDVAQLQEIVKTLQRSIEDRIASLGTQVQGAADAASKAGGAASAVQRSVDQVLDQERKLTAPVAAIGGRMSEVSSALGTMHQAISELTSVVNKLQMQIGDVGNAVKVLQAPVVAPPGPPMSANELLINASRDHSSGKFDLALQEYNDYLKWYGDKPEGSLAQYQIGRIYFTQKDYDNALNAFDSVMQKYPDSAKAPEALFYRAKTLRLLGRPKEAVQDDREFLKRYPKHDLAAQIPR